jgi:hypothetical protein
MMTPTAVLGYVKAEPFRPFRIHMASGRVYEVRHPEMIKVGRTNAIVFFSVSDQGEMFDEWESVSLLLIESISHVETQVS